MSGVPMEQELWGPGLCREGCGDQGGVAKGETVGLTAKCVCWIPVVCVLFVHVHVVTGCYCGHWLWKE